MPCKSEEMQENAQPTMSDLFASANTQWDGQIFACLLLLLLIWDCN